MEGFGSPDDYRYWDAIRAGCSICDERRHYFDQFYVPGIAQRTAELMPVFEIAQEKLKETVSRNKLMTGNRYTGYLYKQT